MLEGGQHDEKTPADREHEMLAHAFEGRRTLTGAEECGIEHACALCFSRNMISGGGAGLVTAFFVRMESCLRRSTATWSYCLRGGRFNILSGSKQLPSAAAVLISAVISRSICILRDV